MSGKQIGVLWGGFLVYAVCVLWSPIRWCLNGGFSSNFAYSFQHSAGYGVIILIVTVLFCLTVRWHETRSHGDES